MKPWCRCAVPVLHGLRCDPKALNHACRVYIIVNTMLACCASSFVASQACCSMVTVRALAPG